MERKDSTLINISHGVTGLDWTELDSGYSFTQFIRSTLNAIGNANDRLQWGMVSVCEHVKPRTVQLKHREMRNQTKPVTSIWCPYQCYCRRRRLFRLFPFYAFQTVCWCAIETSTLTFNGVTRWDPSSIIFCDISFITKLENRQNQSVSLMRACIARSRTQGSLDKYIYLCADARHDFISLSFRTVDWCALRVYGAGTAP